MPQQPERKAYDHVSCLAAYDALARVGQVLHAIDAEQVLVFLKKELTPQLANAETRPHAQKLLDYYAMMVRHKQEHEAFGPPPRPLVDRQQDSTGKSGRPG